jgi:hypothetical protein
MTLLARVRSRIEHLPGVAAVQLPTGTVIAWSNLHTYGALYEVLTKAGYCCGLINNHTLEVKEREDESP